MSLPPNIAGPFDVKPEDLKQINDRQAVELFRELLVIEAEKVGIPATFVDVPADINTPDGGIDAQVSGAAGAMLQAGLVSEGLTCYQIKTGGFSASSNSDIRSLLVQPKHQKGEKQRTKDQLQPRVLHCFENGGNFVVVLFGTDLVGTAENHGAAEITEFMSKIDPAFKAIKVRVLRVNQLCSAIKVLAPGMALRMNRLQGYDKPVFKALSMMEDTSGLEIGNYHSSQALDAVSAQITLAADTVQGFQHVRILGDAGAGKTHLIYRALVASKLRECVLYCGDPEGSLDSGPLAALQRMAPATTIILVADDCDLETAEELAAQFKRRAVKMLLVSIHNASESASAHNHMQVIDIPQLDLALMEAIFKSYGIAADDAKWLASLCEGSPRAAHKLGQYIKSNPTKHRQSI
jgi:plasmid maintenance system antidote protein VapI